MQEIIHIIEKLNPQILQWYFFYGLLITLGVAYLYFIRRKKADNLKTITIVLIIFLANRVIIFNNPILYKKMLNSLSVEDVGFRQYGALQSDTSLFFQQKHVDYLAIGSSQTDAVFGHYAGQHDSFGLLSLAGMGPLDFLLYRQEILLHSPEAIILYLSDFDLSREPELDGAKLAPTQSLGDLLILSSALAGMGVDRGNVIEFVVANILPEYRYQYLFKGFLEKAAGKIEAFPEKNIKEIPDSEIKKIGLRQLRKLNENISWIDHNIGLLAKFLDWSEDENINVFLVEGHYHPIAYAQNIRLHELARSKLITLAQKDGVEFINKENVYVFQEKDYRDPYHVHFDSGQFFTANLIRYIKTVQH